MTTAVRTPVVRLTADDVLPDRGDYFTDGRGLYYVLGLDEDTVLVENCSTLFTVRVPYDAIWDRWWKVR
jgi:hypothetical protein